MVGHVTCPQPGPCSSEEKCFLKCSEGCVLMKPARMSSLVAVSPTYRVGGLTHSHLSVSGTEMTGMRSVTGKVSLGEEQWFTYQR